MIIIVGVIVSPAEQAPLPPRLLSFKSRARRVAATPFDVAEGRLSILELSLFPYFRIKRRQERQRWRRSVCTVLSFLSWPSSPFSSNVANHHFYFLPQFSSVLSFPCCFIRLFVPLIYGFSFTPLCRLFLFTMARGGPVEWRTELPHYSKCGQKQPRFSPLFFSRRGEESFWLDVLWFPVSQTVMRFSAVLRSIFLRSSIWLSRAPPRSFIR